jgi:hypothetical protein
MSGAAEKGNKAGCGERFRDWLDCLVKSGVPCSHSEAEAKCGVERGLFEACCPLCAMEGF